MAKYKVKHTSIMHNGQLYKEGSSVELTEVQAKRLEDFVELIPETVKAKTQAQTQTQNKPQTQKTAKSKSETKPKTEETETGKTETEDEKDGGVDNDK